MYYYVVLPIVVHDKVKCLVKLKYRYIYIYIYTAQEVNKNIGHPIVVNPILAIYRPIKS